MNTPSKFKKTLILIVLSAVLWGTVRWAFQPGIYGRVGIHNAATPLEEAKQFYGPVILVRTWISDPPGTWKDDFAMWQTWGTHETAARLVLIIGVLWIAVCVLVLTQKKRMNHDRLPAG